MIVLQNNVSAISTFGKKKHFVRFLASKWTLKIPTRGPVFGRLEFGSQLYLLIVTAPGTSSILFVEGFAQQHDRHHQSTNNDLKDFRNLNLTNWKDIVLLKTLGMEG